MRDSRYKIQDKKTVNCASCIMNHASCIVIIILLQIAIRIPVYAQEDCEWRTVSGEALAEGMSVEDAQKLAVRRASVTAVEEIAGVRIYGGTTVKNSALVEDIIMSMSEGHILKKEIVNWETELQKISSETPPLPLYKVHAKLCIAKNKEQTDPFFTVSLETDKPVYISGDEARLKIRTGRGAYISIFHLSEDEKFSMLLPNKFQKKHYVEEGKETLFPSQGLGLCVKTCGKKKKDIEYFIVIATKEWFDFEGQLKKDKDISIASFYNALLSIPADKRAMAIGGYEVVEKEY